MKGITAGINSSGTLLDLWLLQMRMPRAVNHRRVSFKNSPSAEKVCCLRRCGQRRSAWPLRGRNASEPRGKPPRTALLSGPGRRRPNGKQPVADQDDVAFN